MRKCAAENYLMLSETEIENPLLVQALIVRGFYTSRTVILNLKLGLEIKNNKLPKALNEKCYVINNRITAKKKSY